MSNFSYDDAALEAGFATGIMFSPDGTKVFRIDLVDKSIHQLSAVDPNDLDTWSSDSAVLNFSGQDSSVVALAFSPDGSKLFLPGVFNGRIFQYSVPDPNDITTWSYDGVSLSVSSPRALDGLMFSPDGTKIFLVSKGDSAVYQYSVINSNDVTTWSFDNVSLSTSQRETSPTGIVLSLDNTKAFIVGSQSDAIHQLSIIDPNDLATWSFAGNPSDINDQETAAQDLAFSPDGTKLFVAGWNTTLNNDWANGGIYQYSGIGPPLGFWTDFEGSREVLL